MKFGVKVVHVWGKFMWGGQVSTSVCVYEPLIYSEGEHESAAGAMVTSGTGFVWRIRTVLYTPGDVVSGDVLPTSMTLLVAHASGRCALAVQISFGKDGNFSEAAFRDVVNACLANSIGNMLNR